MITRYVNTASTAGGDGTTNATVGANRAFAFLSDAIAALVANKPSDNIEILCCGTAPDTKYVEIGAVATSLSYSITIKGNPNDAAGKHPGYWSTNHYRLEFSGPQVYYALLYQYDREITVDGIQIKQSQASHSVGMGNNTKLHSLLNCIVWHNNAVGRGVDQTPGNSIIKNCIICVTQGVVNAGYGVYNHQGTMYVYNSIVRNFSVGLSGATQPIRVKNCSVFNTDYDFYGNFTADHCASDDGSGTNPVTVSNWADQFYNANYATNIDFRLKSTSVLIQAGIGPALDANVPTTDILEYERTGNTTTVGPFEYWQGYIPGAFPSDPYDGEEHRALLTESLYVYDASRTRWVKSLYYSKGATGLKGVTGAGTYGMQGAIGVGGATGAAGIAGPAGATGIGSQGETGSQGITGISGLTGPQGDTGLDPGVTGYINFVMNNPSTGIAGQIMLPYSLQIDSWEVVSSDATSFRSGLKIGPYSAWPPSYSMNGGMTGPHIGVDFKNASYGLSGWAGTTGAYGDWMQLLVEESDSPESLTVALGYHQV